MAGIKVSAVDYEKLYKTATNIRNKASGVKGVTGCMDDIYREVGYLLVQNNWKGESYDKLATILINNRGQIQKYLQYLRNAVPRTMEKIASCYSVADVGAPLAVREKLGKPALDTEGASIAITAKGNTNTELVFNKTAVEQAKKRIDDSFTKAINKLEALRDDLNNLSVNGLWMDEVSTAFFKKFKTNYQKISDMIIKMQGECDKVMDIAIANISSAETSNEIG